MSPEQYCRDKVAPPGSSLHYSLLGLKSDQRTAIIALYALQKELLDIADIRETSIAEKKLHWWQEEIQRIFANNPRHPVSQVLSPAIERYSLSSKLFDNLLHGASLNATYDTYPNFHVLHQYCDSIGGTVARLSTDILKSNLAINAVQQLGIAQHLFALLRDTSTHAQLNRFYIPEDELQRFGLNVYDLTQVQNNEKLQQLFKYQANRIRKLWQESLQILLNQERAKLSQHIILTELNRTLLDEIEADGFLLLQQRVDLTPVRQLWIAWRTLHLRHNRQKRKK